MSIKINLLPWREIRRKDEKKKLLLSSLLGLSFLTIISLLAKYYVNGLAEIQMNSNQALRNEIEILNIMINKVEKIKKEKSDLLDRILLLQELENSSVLVIHFFDELIKLIPKQIYLSRIKGIGNRVILQGYSDSSHSVSLLMQKIENNPWMQAPNLIEIKNEELLKENNSFSISFTLKSKQADNLSL
ncbi:Fimbrial assembly protein (PilN) [Legionella massiliensis]|uniref:Fimbrial assembly protein (PilN) n=1 Tax=Legionella massiliensis TaxID=1034943 RepID=A0A078KW21_9GAMM|nr:PilN domain-containing protein [Legionella massiliensis]CDZ78650.1 Fimbrial assembly protein (PilN) [Legionella massiliensis]CEE14388.1 Fimbrial assembly protein (PilN) [Legionella massiliensis]